MCTKFGVAWFKLPARFWVCEGFPHWLCSLRALLGGQASSMWHYCHCPQSPFQLLCAPFKYSGIMSYGFLSFYLKWNHDWKMQCDLGGPRERKKKSSHQWSKKSNLRCIKKCKLISIISFMLHLGVQHFVRKNS